MNFNLAPLRLVVLASVASFIWTSTTFADEFAACSAADDVYYIGKCTCGLNGKVLVNLEGVTEIECNENLNDFRNDVDPDVDCYFTPSTYVRRGGTQVPATTAP